MTSRPVRGLQPHQAASQVKQCVPASHGCHMLQWHHQDRSYRVKQGTSYAYRALKQSCRQLGRGGCCPAAAAAAGCCCCRLSCSACLAATISLQAAWACIARTAHSFKTIIPPLCQAALLLRAVCTCDQHGRSGLCPCIPCHLRLPTREVQALHS